METNQGLYAIFEQSTGVYTDSRTPRKGGLFFALSGPHFDGNQFALAALEQGASAAVVSDPQLKEHPQCVYFPDVLKALQDLASEHRKKFNGPVIALTGSNGKTTTKELMLAVLSQDHTAYATQGNLNNHIGVPLSLLAMPLDADYYIIEMGANHRGEIAQLCTIAHPDIGYITNFGSAHLEGFGSLEGVVKGKSELYQYLIENNKNIIGNEDDPKQMELLKDHAPFTFGTQPSSALHLSYVDKEGVLEVHWKGHKAKSNLYGAYNLTNMGAAIALGFYFNHPAGQIAQGIESYIPKNNRSQVVNTGKNTLVLDAYNANPTSMQAALTAFNQAYTTDKMVFLGDMLELGEYSMQEHQNIVTQLASLNLDQIILIGKAFAQTKNPPAHTLFFTQTADCISWLEKKDITGKNVLLKGSRGMALEKLQAYL